MVYIAGMHNILCVPVFMTFLFNAWVTTPIRCISLTEEPKLFTKQNHNVKVQ